MCNILGIQSITENPHLKSIKILLIYTATSDLMDNESQNLKYLIFGFLSFSQLLTVFIRYVYLQICQYLSFMVIHVL